jgi:hypothetical protein
MIGPESADNELFRLLESQPLLRSALLQALKTGRWFVTVSYQKKYEPDPKANDLWHTPVFDFANYFTAGYPAGPGGVDIAENTIEHIKGTLDKLKKDFLARYFPQNVLDSDSGPMH